MYLSLQKILPIRDLLRGLLDGVLDSIFSLRTAMMYGFAIDRVLAAVGGQTMESIVNIDFHSKLIA